MKEAMTVSERFSNLVRGKSFDRLPMVEWVPWWNKTVDRWKKEGVPANDGMPYLEMTRNVQLYFGLDSCIEYWLNEETKETPQAPFHGAGIMKTAEDYQKIKRTLHPDPSRQISPQFIEWMKKCKAEGNTIFWCSLEGCFWYARVLFGIEAHLYSFYDEPDLLKEICHEHTEWLKKAIEFLGNNVPNDFIVFGEDMSYNNGPMLSKELFDEFLAPYYREIIPYIKKLDIPLFLDSDGDITQAIDWYASVGVDGCLPLERQAGVDVSLYLKKQPELFFLGHFDKMCMKFGEDAMRVEFERLLPSMKSCRFIPSVDHQTPPDVSAENYQIYVRLLREYTSMVGH
jgi:uroporphyrinogen-III decarboxylase